MAKKRAKKKKSTKSKKTSAEPRKQLHPDIVRSIIAVGIWAFALISLLALVDLAGTVGQYLNDVLRLLFGWGLYIVPVLFAALGLAIFRERKPSTDTDEAGEYRRPKSLIGYTLFALSLFAILHLGVAEEGFSAVEQGSGGGYVGMILAIPLFSAFGIWAASIIILALFTISLILMFNVSLAQIAQISQMLKARTQPADEVQKQAPAKATQEREGVTIKSMKALGFKSRQANENTGDAAAAQEQAPKPKLKINNMVAKAREKDASSSAETGPIRAAANPDWKLPSVELLDDELSQPESGDIKKNAQIIKDTLQNFNIPVEMNAVSIGPTVTQYTLRPESGVKLNQIVALQNDLALALAAHPIRIEAPIPGKSLVGIEVPNKSVAVVRLREMLETKDFHKAKSNLSLVFGRDVAGNPELQDLAKMPHMLIAGATGSGKSIALNVMLLSLLYQNSPQQLRLILVDPKRVEFAYFNDIPHLLTPVITDAKKTIHSLKWAVSEMDRRYKLLSETGKKNIDSYNKTNKDEQLPYIVIVIDELADLMSIAASEVEAMIIRLAQMARAVGIHLILATQRPSVNVITGLIKANITTRLAFNVASGVDSRTIIDTAGAEKLLGSGDMLFISNNITKPRRVQGAFVSEEDIEQVTAFLREAAKPEYNDEVVEPKKNIKFTSSGGVTIQDEDDPSSEDDMYEEAKQAVVRAGKGSASFLQRKLRIGYARAARLLDLLEENGVVGPPDGSRPREVLMSADQLGQQQAQAQVQAMAAQADQQVETIQTQEQQSEEQAQEQNGSQAQESSEEKTDDDDVDGPFKSIQWG